MPTSFDRKEAERQAMARVEAQYQKVSAPHQQQAMATLKALSKEPGALKIVTNVPDPKAPNGLLPKHPHFWVAHDVVRIEGPDHNGNVWAYSAHDEDYTMGDALAVLQALTRYAWAEPFTEERVELGARRRAERAAAGHAEVQVTEPMRASGRARNAEAKG